MNVHDVSIAQLLLSTAGIGTKGARGREKVEDRKTTHVVEVLGE